MGTQNQNQDQNTQKKKPEVEQTVADKYEIITQNPRQVIRGIGTVDLRTMTMKTADKVYEKTKGLISLK